MKHNCCKLFLAAIAAAVAFGANAQSWFCGEYLNQTGQVTSSCIQSGTVYYEASTMTYTLNNAVINAGSKSIFDDGNYGRDHTIIVKGNCVLSTGGNWGITCFGNVTIKGESTNDKISVSAVKTAISSLKNLTVQNCSLRASAKYACQGGLITQFASTITFNNCKANLSGTESAFEYIASVAFKGCQITSPDHSLIKFSKYSYVYTSDDTYVKDLVIDVVSPTDAIAFEDATVKALCVAKWDTNGDGNLSFNEAAAVTSIGSSTFYARSITSFNELQYFTGITEIPDRAFSNCGSLEYITLPENITKIGDRAFAQTSKLILSMPLDNKIESVGEYAFMFSGVSDFIGPAVKTIGNYAFGGDNKLRNLSLSSALSTIGDYAFTGCSMLSFTIPSSVTSIGNYAFQNCTALKGQQTIGQPGKPLRIGFKAFEGTSITTMTIGCTSDSFTVDSCFYGNTPESFRLFVNNNMFYWARHTMANKWSEYDRERILPYALCNDKRQALVCFDIDVTMCSGEGYIISNYNADKAEVLTVSLGSKADIPAGTPVMVYTFSSTDPLIYFEPVSTPLTPYKYNNLLVGTVSSTYVSPSFKSAYIFAADSKFNHVSTNWRDNLVPGCSAYLKLPDELDATTTWTIGGKDPTGGITTTKGDIDNNGVVDVTDLNILINIILGKSSASDYGGRADVTGEGNIDVSDINAVINIILGK